MRTRLFAVLTLVAVMLPSAEAGSERKKAQAQVEDYVNKLTNKQGFRRITPIDDESLTKLQPGSHWFGVLFPQYPIGIEPPSPLKVGNVFVIDKEGKMHTLSDIAAVEKYCKAHFPPAQSEADAIAVMRAWLKLSQNIHGDGFYQFEFALPFSVEVNEAKKPTKATGIARVKPIGGNKGQITASIAFQADGKLASVKDAAKLVEGIRPICQATRLLDADPVIRKMAERDLLVMGRTCEEYLFAQRARAGDELRRALDRVWQRILDEDR